MSWFDEQIRIRKENDQAAFEDSIREMTGAVLGRRFRFAAEEDPNRTGDAITEVLKYYHVNTKGVSEALREAEDFQEALESVLQPTGIIRRTVTLPPKWYRDAAEAMLGTRKEDGSLIALIPDGWGGYWYRDPDTKKKVRLRRKTADRIGKEAIVFYRPFPQTKLTIGSLIRYMLRLISLGYHNACRIHPHCDRCGPSDTVAEQDTVFGCDCFRQHRSPCGNRYLHGLRHHQQNAVFQYPVSDVCEDYG